MQGMRGVHSNGHEHGEGPANKNEIMLSIEVVVKSPVVRHLRHAIQYGVLFLSIT